MELTTKVFADRLSSSDGNAMRPVTMFEMYKNNRRMGSWLISSSLFFIVYWFILEPEISFFHALQTTAIYSVLMGFFSYLAYVRSKKSKPKT